MSIIVGKWGPEEIILQATSDEWTRFIDLVEERVRFMSPMDPDRLLAREAVSIIRTHAGSTGIVRIAFPQKTARAVLRLA